MALKLDSYRNYCYFFIQTAHLRALTAIICFTAFFALQYGKLISYWHCRLINISAAAPCDCVKQLLDTHKEDKHSAATLKEKTEEIVLFYEPEQQTRRVVVVSSACTMAYIDVIPQTCNGSVFQPPRI